MRVGWCPRVVVCVIDMSKALEGVLARSRLGSGCCRQGLLRCRSRSGPHRSLSCHSVLRFSTIANSSRPMLHGSIIADTPSLTSLTASAGRRHGLWA